MSEDSDGDGGGRDGGDGDGGDGDDALGAAFSKAGQADADRETGRKVQRLLELARTHLGMDLAWVSHFDLDPTRGEPDVPDAQVLDVVSGDAASMGVQVGTRLERSGSFCVRVLAGGLPSAVTDARRHPITRDLPVTATLGIGSYLGAPLHNSDGQVSGMVCCLSRTPTPDLDGPARSFLAFVANLISDHLSEDEPNTSGGSISEPCRTPVDEDPVLGQVRDLLSRESVQMVFQPVWRLPEPAVLPDPAGAVGAVGASPVAVDGTPAAGARVVAYEALARFPDTVFTRPDLAFAAATRAGLGVELERLAARTALAQLHLIPAGTLMCVNLSAEAITDPTTQDVLLRACARARTSGRMVGVEVTEHTQVSDYTELAAAAERLRAAGAYIVIDDAGAGYASFSHILQLRPQVIKVDISLIRDIDTDPVKKALTRALAAFADEIGAYLVAEGVERVEEAAAVHELGVRMAQGYLYGQPGPLQPPTPTATASRLLRRPSAEVGEAMSATSGPTGRGDTSRH